MKKIICLVLIFTMMLTACSKWKVEIVDPTKPIENEQELAETEKETESELYIKSVSSEKIEAKNLSTDGFNNGLGSSLDFQLINNQKALFFTYKAEDPLAGIEVDIRVFLYDFVSDKMELIEELHFDNSKQVSVYEREGKTKVVFSNKYSTEVLSIDQKTFETEFTELEVNPGKVSPIGFYALNTEHITVRDIEDYNDVYVIEPGDKTEFISWSPNGQYMLVQKEHIEMIYSLYGEKIAEFNAVGTKNWCADEKHFVFSELQENGSWKSFIIDLSSGEIKETESVTNELLAEKDFAVVGNKDGKICIKEYSTGIYYETDVPNQFQKVVYCKENETLLAVSYGDETEIWKMKLEWTKEKPKASEPAEPDFPEEPYEAENAEKYEAENFFYSEEGYNDMAFFAGWFGAKEFESNQKTVDSSMLRFFANELYEAAGEEAMDTEGSFFRVPERLGNKYLLKYFGIDYQPEESDPDFEKETNSYKMSTAGCGAPFELLSYSHPLNISENRFSVKILVLEYQDELGKHFAFSEAVFDVMEDEDGKFLRLVSNKIIDRFGKAPFEMQAQSLTRQMLQVMNKKNIEEENLLISNGLAGNFTMHAAIFVNASNGFDKNSPYVGSFGKTSGYAYYLPMAELERVAFEVFGIEDFQYGFNSNFEYDSEKDWYLTGFDWGMGSGYDAKDMVTTVSDNICSVEFTLLYYGANSEGDPELMEGERYRMDFEIIDGEFLRYAGFEKA
ncbi:MAG: hypothetical protein IKL18_09350 [Oscillospiraceae bacterium]|nr:hypothetical protein [Oscillospiraceae bacterium]MBR6658354.1 hypothetical protein [Oscillospiraceae bacterium]